MIYTVTFNPAIDYVVRLDNVAAGEVNRAKSEQIYFGGKGINVSLVLAELGIKSVALGFAAGFTGRAVEDGVRARGVKTDFIYLDSGCTRINVKIKAREETEINGQGPEISESAAEKLYDKLGELKDEDILVLAGSIPNSLPADTYEKILRIVSGKNVRVAVDAAGKLLLNTLKYKPFLVKPNNHELGEMFGKELSTTDEVIEHAFKLKEMGAENVLVSMAGDGALLIDGSGALHKCAACRGQVRNSVGAGDSMVAGFIAGLSDGDNESALKLGTACGGATAFSDDLAKKNEIYELLRQIL